MFDNIVTYHILCSDELPAYDAIGYQYITAGNGLFIRTETRFFTAIVPVKRAIVRGLPLLKGSFRLLVPKLPESLLTAVFADARLARRKKQRPSASPATTMMMKTSSATSIRTATWMRFGAKRMIWMKETAVYPTLPHFSVMLWDTNGKIDARWIMNK